MSTTPGTTDVQPTPNGDAPPFWERPDPSPRRARKHALADDVRRLISRISQLDAEAIDDDALAQIETAVGAINGALADAPDLLRHGSAARAPGPDSMLFERSPFTGRSNPMSAPLVLRYDAETLVTTGTATYDERFEGPPGLVHGGHVMAAFDDLLGVAQVASGFAGMTGELTVRMLAGTPLNTEITYEGGVTGSERRKIFAWGTAHANGLLVGRAHGIFVQPRHRS